jgi:hypothetical protein
MLSGGPQNTIKSHLVFTALFCFAPFSVFFSRMSAPYLISRNVQLFATSTKTAATAVKKQCHLPSCGICDVN